MIRGIHHTSISTANLDRLLPFYRDLLGLEEVFDGSFSGTEIENVTALEKPTGRVVMLRSSNTHLELFEYATPVPQPGNPQRPVCDHGLTHICFDVQDLEQEYKRLLDAGMMFHCPPQLLERSILTTYGRDPDGNVVELQEVLTPKSKLAMENLRLSLEVNQA